MDASRVEDARNHARFGLHAQTQVLHAVQYFGDRVAGAAHDLGVVERKPQFVDSGQRPDDPDSVAARLVVAQRVDFVQRLVDKALYKIHSLGYNKAGSNRIRIVRPLTGIDKLWLSLDDTKIMCRPRNPVTEILDGVEYLCLGVETETGVVPRILNTGSVHFFRRGESGTEPEQVGFGVIFPLIAYCLLYTSRCV